MNAFLEFIISLFSIFTGAAAGSAPSAASVTRASDLAGISVDERWVRIRTIIAERINAGPYPNFDFSAAELMADMENGLSIGLFTNTFQATNSLYNRHKGEGQQGVPNSDGVWTGRTFYASPDDPDLRIYNSLEDSVDDFLQLMGRRVYTAALGAALDHDLPGYISAVAAVPYSTQHNYAAALTARAHSLELA